MIPLALCMFLVEKTVIILQHHFSWGTSLKDNVQ